MATDETGATKKYLKRKFSSGGGGIIYNGVVYPEGEAGIKAFADALAVGGAFDNVIITQNGFQGGYATGTLGMPILELLGYVEEIIEEWFGTTTPTARSIMFYADYSEGIART
jgi:hypothetical protein